MYFPDGKVMVRHLFVLTSYKKPGRAWCLILRGTGYQGAHVYMSHGVTLMCGLMLVTVIPIHGCLQTIWVVASPCPVFRYSIFGVVQYDTTSQDMGVFWAPMCRHHRNAYAEAFQTLF